MHRRHELPAAPPASPSPVDVAATSPVDPQIQRLLDQARVHLGMELAWVSRLTGEHQRLDVLSGNSAAMGGLSVGDHLPQAESFCVRVLAGALPPVITDARRHPVTRDLEVTTQLSIGAYASAPLHDSSGHVAGMLCCLSRTPDTSLDEGTTRYLGLIAALISDHLQRLPDPGQGTLEADVRALLAPGAVQPVFQPVVQLSNGCARGYEALARFTVSPFSGPDTAFSAATRVGLGVQLEQHAARAALQQLQYLRAGETMCVNLSAEALTDIGVQDMILEHAARSEHGGQLIGVEITEHTPIGDYTALVAATGRLRASGVRLVVDDAGAGYASFRHILQLRPDVIKMDISLVRDVDTDPIRQALTRSLVTFAADSGAHLVAEGIERDAERRTMRELGVGFVQGYLYGRPGPLPAQLWHPRTATTHLPTC